jgi:hypothetical protein
MYPESLAIEYGQELGLDRKKVIEEDATIFNDTWIKINYLTFFPFVDSFINKQQIDYITDIYFSMIDIDDNSICISERQYIRRRSSPRQYFYEYLNFFLIPEILENEKFSTPFNQQIFQFLSVAHILSEYNYFFMNNLDFVFHNINIDYAVIQGEYTGCFDTDLLLQKENFDSFVNSETVKIFYQNEFLFYTTVSEFFYFQGLSEIFTFDLFQFKKNTKIKTFYSTNHFQMPVLHTLIADYSDYKFHRNVGLFWDNVITTQIDFENQQSVFDRYISIHNALLPERVWETWSMYDLLIDFFGFEKSDVLFWENDLTRIRPWYIDQHIMDTLLFIFMNNHQPAEISLLNISPRALFNLINHFFIYFSDFTRYVLKVSYGDLFVVDTRPFSFLEHFFMQQLRAGWQYGTFVELFGYEEMFRLECVLVDNFEFFPCSFRDLNSFNWNLQIMWDWSLDFDNLMFESIFINSQFDLNRIRFNFDHFFFY